MEAEDRKTPATQQVGHLRVGDSDVAPAGKRNRPSSRRVCSGEACQLSAAGSSSKDSKERLASMRKLVMAVVLCAVFMSVEVAGGVKANSLAVLTDAVHLLSDLAAFAISLFSLWAAGWEATPRQSYGFFRVEILGALFSVQLIWLLAGVLVVEATSRIISGRGEVQGCVMFAVSAFGLVVNTIMAALLGHDHGHAAGLGHGGALVSDRNRDHAAGGHQHIPGRRGCGREHDNHGDLGGGGGHGHTDRKDVREPLLIRDRESDPDDDSRTTTSPEFGKTKRGNITVDSAYLHALGDSIQSIGVMIGGAIIWYKPEWKLIDLICTLVFSVIVLATTVKQLRSIVEVLTESTPREINAEALEKGIREMDGVVAVHELHIWAITVGRVLLAGHVVVGAGADEDDVLERVADYIRREHHISHVTIQIERQ